MLKNTKYSAFFSCLQFPVLNSLHCNVILKPKQVICLKSIFLKRNVLCCSPDWLRKVFGISYSSHIVICQEEIGWHQFFCAILPTTNFYSISKINLGDTWPATTRVFSRASRVAPSEEPGTRLLLCVYNWTDNGKNLFLLYNKYMKIHFKRFTEFSWGIFGTLKKINRVSWRDPWSIQIR